MVGGCGGFRSGRGGSDGCGDIIIVTVDTFRRGSCSPSLQHTQGRLITSTLLSLSCSTRPEFRVSGLYVSKKHGSAPPACLPACGLPCPPVHLALPRDYIHTLRLRSRSPFVREVM